MKVLQFYITPTFVRASYDRMNAKGKQEGRMKTEYEIKAMWDPEACVWVASSEEVPGLCTEAETLEILIEKLSKNI